MNAKLHNISELDKQCTDKNILSVIAIRIFNTFNLKSAIKSIGLEKSGGRSTTTVADFSIHRELGKKGKGGLSDAEWKYQYSKKRINESPGSQRFSEIDKSKIAQVPDMIRRGVRHGLKIVE